MNFKLIKKGETFLSFKPDSIKDVTASQNLIQIQDLRGKVLYGTIEYPDTEDNRIKLKEMYE